MFSTIMVPLDGSSVAEGALEPAAELARLTESELVLVRNQDVPESVVGHPGKYPVLHEVFEQEGQECELYLEKQAAPLRAAGLQVRCQLLHGAKSWQVLAEAAETMKADLIVLTSHGRSGVSRFLLGSVAEKLARVAPCPVLITGRPGVSKE